MNKMDDLTARLLLAEVFEKQLQRDALLSDEAAKKYQVIHQIKLSLQRQIAALKNEPYCEPIEFPLQWDTGASLPHLLQNDHKTFLLFYLKNATAEISPAGIENTITTPIGIVEFKTCYAVKTGSPNDEVLHGHPLYYKGLDYYQASS